MPEEADHGSPPDGSAPGEENARPLVADATQAAPVRPAKPWEQPSAGAAAPSVTPSATPAQAPAELREDQVQNAVAFLSHPKVRSSTDSAKRTFLEKKGLTAAEIEEAFRRVPSGSSPAPAGPVVQPGATAPTQQVVAYAQPVPSPTPPPEPLRWSQVVLGAGLTALVVVGVKRLLEPYRYQILHTLSRAIMPAEDQKKLDEASSEASGQKEGGAESPDIALQLSEAVQAMGNQQAQLAQAITALSAKIDSAPSATAPSGPAAGGSELQEAFRELQGTIKGLSSSLEGMKSWPAQSPTGPELLRDTTERSFPLQQEDSTRGPGSLTAQDKGKARMDPPVTKAPSYQEVMQMLQEGKVPPGIRSDIKDTPPNPSQAPSNPRQSARKKPWERSISPSAKPTPPPVPDTEVAEAPPPFWMRGAPTEPQEVFAGSDSLQERSPSLAAASTEVEPETWGTSSSGSQAAPAPPDPAADGAAAPGAGEETDWRPPAMPKRTLPAAPAQPPAPGQPEGSAESKSPPASYSAALRGEAQTSPRHGEPPEDGPGEHPEEPTAGSASDVQPDASAEA